jgi:replicative DNA helicase
MSQQEEKLSGALQENVLTLLCFSDEHAKTIRAAVNARLFESSVFKEIAANAINFLDQYGEPIKEHLPDHLEDVLKGDDVRKAESYERVLKHLYVSREEINAEYVLKQLNKFVRMQNLKSTVIQAVEAINDGKLDDAEVLLQKGLSHQIVSFEPGLNLGSAEDVMSILDHPEEEGFDLGIPALDQAGIIPRRKEMFMFMAPRGRGKSWFVTHATKMAMVQGWSAIIISLEMSERRYAARLLQSFFSISRREAQVRVPRLVMDRSGTLVDITSENIERMTMSDPDIKAKLRERATREFQRRPPLRIKEFPTNSLTLPMLEAYLDGLERYENFTPDLICLDYPDLMALDPKNLRMEIGSLIAGFRGLVGKRNAAGLIVSQGNRESEKAQLVTGDMAAEDISKIATSDTVVTYSQTKAEHALGLARLFVEKARNEEAKFQVLVTQAYGIGQFALDAVRLPNDYWNLIGTSGQGGDDEPAPPRGRRRPTRDADDEQPTRRRRIST